MTDLEIVRLFEENHPRTIEDIQAFGLSPRYIDRGASRKVYQLTKTLLVKIPLNDDLWQIKESKNEIDFLESIYEVISRENEELLSSMMPLYYGNKETGIILTKFYPHPALGKYGEGISALRTKFHCIGISDLHWQNFRVTETGQLVVIDLGHTF